MPPPEPDVDIQPSQPVSSSIWRCSSSASRVPPTAIAYVEQAGAPRYGWWRLSLATLLNRQQP